MDSNEEIRNQLLNNCALIVARRLFYTKDNLKELLSNNEFLDYFFRLFDTHNTGFLIQEKWIEFLKERFISENELSFLERIECVTFSLCGASCIDKQCFNNIFTTKGVSEKLFRVLDPKCESVITSNVIMEFLQTVTNSRARCGFDKRNVELLESLFKQTVVDRNEITREDFHKIVTSKNPFFTERVFQIFDRDNSGTISLQEFIDAMYQFAGQTTDDKIQFLFKVYDLDGDGLIQLRELQHVMRACMEENDMSFSDQQLEELTLAMFQDGDPDNSGVITYEGLKSQLHRHVGLLENISISIDRWLIPPKPKETTESFKSRIIRHIKPYQLSKTYFKNNYVFLMFMCTYALINAVLFVTRSVQYREANYYVIFARACGQCLNFNCAFILVLMLRQSITYLRTRGFCNILPLDHHIYIHKLVGIVILILSLIHTIMHIINFGTVVINEPVINYSNFTLSEWLLTDHPGLFGLVPGCANPTGVSILIIMGVMFICSGTFIRKSGYFEIFYWTHLLYIPFWVLLVFHGPNFWKWFLAPGIVYAIERACRFWWMKSDWGRTYISSGLLLPSKVTHLVIKRPHHFDYMPGDYVFVNIPTVAKYEWHPFTISSAPEQPDYIWLHIRCVGQWTNKLYQYFEREHARLHNGHVSEHSMELKSLNGSELNGKPKKVEFSDGITNEAFTSENGLNDPIIVVTSPTNSTKSVNSVESKSKLLNPSSRFEKSLSMPNIRNKNKKPDRVVALKDCKRSESEQSFSDYKLRMCRQSQLELAYKSPQNKSLAQTFRYMRNKPTIIAFKTPSVDIWETRREADTVINKAKRGILRARSRNESLEEDIEKSNQENSEKTFANYPVGKPLEIYLDGPYGAPSSHMFKAQHAVLIATGIGVTPFASILQSIMYRYWKARHTCPKCQHTWTSQVPDNVMHLKKVDFFWINRNQRSFEWFVSLLSQLEIEQAEMGGDFERFLDMHMYITSALQKTDMKAVGLQLALDLLHEKEKRDLITGLKTRTIAGRPNWDKVFTSLRSQNRGKITVFYCGPPQLARVLRYKTHQYGFHFRKEVF